MKISAHPLIVAAAFGLLGPAALIDDDAAEDTIDDMRGVWCRAEATAPPADPLLDLGPRFEVIPVEDRLVVDTLAQGSGTWSRAGEDAAHTQLQLDGATITRSLSCAGDVLQLTTVVDRDGQRHAWSASYTRAS
jgi:hypothetical protein